MKKKIIYIGILTAIFLGIGGAGLVYASHHKNTATNVVTIGKVSIALHNEDDKEVSPEEETAGRTISAEEAVKKEVSIENKGNYAAYVRVKMKKEWISAQDGFAYTSLDGDAICPDYKSDWVEGTGEDEDYTYYYYQQILPAAATVSFMDTYHVSAEKLDLQLLKDYHEKDVSITGQIRVQAEAVQADYISDELLEIEDGKIVGWNKEEVSFEGFVESNATPIPTSDRNSEEAGVEFVGGTDEFVNFKDGNSDLFLSTKGVLPGQEVSQSIGISNTGDGLLDVYLQAQLPEGENNTELLEHLHIVVEKVGTGEIVYEGSVLEHASGGEAFYFGDTIFLGSFAPGEAEELKVTITLDPKWKKDSCETTVLWTFNHEVHSIDSALPTEEPTATPTEEPTAIPTKEPTATPTEVPTPAPTDVPTTAPTKVPTATPTATPAPTATPTKEPTVAPTEEPTKAPTATPKPTKEPEVSVVTTAKPSPHVAESYPTKTGDSTPIFFWLIMEVVSFVGMIFVGGTLIRRKK